MAVNISKIVNIVRKGHHFHLYMTILFVMLLLTILVGPRFLSPMNLISMAYQMPLIGFLAIGMMISELSGGINLSIVANANFNGIIIAIALRVLTGGRMAEAGTPLIIVACLTGLALTVVIGLFNGILIAKLNIPAILVTLGTMTLLKGISIVITKGYTLSGFPKQLIALGNGSLAGIPVSILFYTVVVIGTHFVLNRSSFGQKLYMTGANQKACRFSNVNVDRVIIIEYVLSACFAFFTSLIMIGQMNSVKANYAESFVLVAVLATFLGGVDPNGGFGKLFGMVLAAIILQLISTGLNLMRLDPFTITTMWGAIIIIVLIAKELAEIVTRKIKQRKASGAL